MSSVFRMRAAMALVASALIPTSPRISRAESPPACAVIGRANVARCALVASATVRAEREGVAAAEGRATATAPWFPANPTLSATLGRRSGAGGRSEALNYSAALSQEIELAGRRGALRREAAAGVAARAQDLTASARRTAGDAYVAYFASIAARDALEVARRLETTAQQIARVTRGRADAGAGAPLDAEIADAASLRAVQGRLAAEGDVRSASARLASMLGRDPMRALDVEGALEPLRGSEALARAVGGGAVRERPEVRALASEARAFDARAEAFRRARIPGITLQVFAQNDGFDERVYGAGVSVPIPLPQPVGRLFTGEIREAESLARQATARSDALARAFAADLASAVADYEARQRERALFTPERVDRSERLLSEVGVEIESGRLAVRDALLAQQQLIEVLRGYVEARRALCVASVDLAVAAGVPLEGEGR